MTAALCAVALSLSLSSAGAAAGGNKTFSFTGGEEAFSVPDGVTSLDVTAVGGEGGVGVGQIPGGFGAVASGRLAVTPGQILFVEVGGNGSLPTGGFNGGGDGGQAARPGGGGGGGTDIRTISSAGAATTAIKLNSRLLTAGGGGGGGAIGFDSFGGLGGQSGLPTLMGNGSNGGDGTPSAGDPSIHGGLGAAGGKQTDAGPFSYGFGWAGFSADDPYGGSGGGGGGGWVGGGPSALPGNGEGPRGSPYNDPSPHGGGGGGGGGGSSHFASTVSNTSIATDTTGTPKLTIAYKPGGGNASGLKFGKVKLNKKKGTAILPVTVPGTGMLSIGGKGLVKKRPAPARALGSLAKEITEPGTYKLKVRPKGKKKAKLSELGKLKVKAVITFKPSSGDAVHDTKKIKLRKS